MTKRFSFAFAAVACLALGGCNMGALASAGSVAPATIAQHTTADETAMRGVETAYKLTRTLGEIAVDAGILKGANATKAADLDNKLYAAVKLARTAYATFNSASLSAAAQNVATLADQVNTLVKGK